MRASLLLPFLLCGCSIAVNRMTGIEPGRHGVAAVTTERVAASDGVLLATDVYLPEPKTAAAPGDGRWPTILIRTPYGKRNGQQRVVTLAKLFARHGYAVVVQDVRGRFDSDGEWYPFAHEQADGLAAFEWTKAQPFCDGRIATFGLSYYGYTQWALGVQAPEGLKAMVPMVISTDLYHWFYEGGAFKPELASTWALSVSDPKANVRSPKSQLMTMYRHLPPIEADDAVLRDLPWYDEWLEHPTPGQPWEGWLPKDAPSRVKVPVLLVGGWFDIFSSDQLRDFEALSKNPDARGSAILMGPWNHFLGLMGHSDTPIGADGDIFRAFPFLLQWLDHTVKGQGEAPTWGPVVSFEVGAGKWHSYASWPPPTSQPITFELSDDHLVLPQPTVTRPITESGKREYVYDPSNPVPTTGGRTFLPQLSMPRDQRAVEKRKDVLHFAGVPVIRDLHVAGRATASLCVSSSAEDTAFTARLLDVDEHGHAVGILDGIRFLSYRDGDGSPTALTPGTPVTLQIPLGDIDWRLRAGHALGLDVSSSNFPRFARHPNVFGSWAHTAATTTAHQVLHTGEGCASTLSVSIMRETRP